MIKKLLIAALLALSTVAAPVFSGTVAVYADEATGSESAPENRLQISPTTNYLTLIAGRSLEYTFTISNPGDTAYSYNVSAAPYSVSGEEYNINFNAETNRTQLSRWIKFVNDDGSTTSEYHGTLAAGEEKRLKYIVSVPEDIPNGGQYATIMVELDTDSAETSSTGVTPVPRVAMILYGRTDGDSRDEASITDYKVSTFLTSGHVIASSLVKNTGNTDFDTVQSFEVTTIFGKTLYSTDEQKYSVLPETERRISFEWEHTPNMGIFRVHYKVAALGEIRDETKFVIIMPIYMIILMIILLTLFIIWLIIIVRKRRERKSRLLV